MKKILDTLMARQQRLLASLGDTQSPVVTSQRPSVATHERIRDEEVALAEALAALEHGDIAAARVLLSPFLETAILVKTLTTSSRICSTEGQFDEALRRLEQAERIDPTDKKVWRLMAELFAITRRANDEVRYRRKLAFVDRHPPAQVFVDLVRALLKATPKAAPPAKREIRLAVEKLALAPDATAEIRVRMAEAVYAFDVLAKEARTQYRSASTAECGEIDVTARWLRFIDWCNHVGAEVRRLIDEGVPAHRPMVAMLSNVAIFPRLQWIPVVDDGRAILRDFVVQRLRVRSEDAATPLLMTGAKLAELRVPESLPVIERRALLLGGMPEYYHNTIEFLSALAVAEQAGVGADLPVVVNDDLAPFQVEQLAMLGYGEDRLIRVRADQPIQFRSLVVPSRLVRGGRWIDPMLPRWYRSRLVSSSLIENKPNRRLYLCRTDTGGRSRVHNDEAVSAFLERLGYERVTPDQLTVRQQVDLFAQASHIVASADSGLTNMVFARPGTRLVVFHNRHLVEAGGDTYFDALAAACGHRFHAIHCAPARVVTGQRIVAADFDVDLGTLAAGLLAVENQQPAVAVSE